MIKERFAKDQISAPQTKEVEFVASEIHESKRIPDPYIFFARNGRFYLPFGEKADDYIERGSHLGKLEYKAFDEIQKWLSDKNDGVSIWFSPPYPSRRYFYSKVIISEIINLPDSPKIIFNREIVLEISSQDLLKLAQTIDPEIYLPETLRSTPLFPNHENFVEFVSKLADISSQAKAINDDSDLQIKTETYAALNDIKTSIHTHGNNFDYVLAREAKQRGFMGTHLGTCPPTAFGMMEQRSLSVGETKTLKCTCPFCMNKVEAKISGGRIHCPICGKSAEYIC